MTERFTSRYVCDEFLGSGGLGKVYRIHNQRAEDFVLKVFKTKGRFMPGALEEDIEIFSRLHHPHLVRVYGFLPQVQRVQGMEETGPGIIFEFAEGVGLENLGEGLSYDIWEDLLAQALGALHYLHRRNILHGNLKPANFRVNKKHLLKITDFGLTRHLGNVSVEVRSNADGLAPEALLGKATAVSDLFSLGVVFYRCMTGVLPYQPDQEPHHRFLTLPPTLQELKKKIPVSLSRVVARLLHPDPKQRFSSARNALRALNFLSRKKYEGVESVDSDTALKKMSVVGHGELRSSWESGLTRWHRGEASGPLWLLHGDVAVGKTHLLREILWQAALRGFVTREILPMHSLEDLMAERDALQQKSLWIFVDLHRRGVSDWNLLERFLAEHAVKGRNLGLALEFRRVCASKNLEGLFQRASKIQGVRTFPINSFTEEESRQFIEEEFYDGPFSKEVHQLLHQFGEGNPGLLSEIARLAIRRGGACFLKQGLEENDLTAVALPLVLREATRVEWQSLPESTQRILVASVVLGRGFFAEDYQRVLEISQSELVQGLEVLKKSSWIRESQDGVEFLRPAYKKYLLGIFGEKSVYALHVKLFEALRQRDSSDPVLLARLAWGASRYSEFLEIGIRAVQQLLETARFRESVELCESLLKVSPAQGPQESIYAYLGEAHAALSEVEPALRAYERWYHYAEEDGTGLRTLKYRCLKGELYLKSGALSLAREQLQLALEIADSSNHESHRAFHAQVYFLLGSVYEQEGNFKSALRIYEEGLVLVRQESASQVRLLMRLGSLLLNHGNKKKARLSFEEALRISIQLDFLEGITDTVYALGTLSQNEGDCSQALSYYERAFDIVEKLGDPLKKVRVLNHMVSVLLEMADYPHALAHAERAQSLLGHQNSSEEKLNNDLHLLSIAVYLGNSQALREEEFVSLTQRLQSSSMLGKLYRLHGESHRLQRQFKPALECYVQSYEAFLKSQHYREANIALLYLALTECWAGDLPMAKKWLAAWDENYPVEGTEAEIHHLLEEFLELKTPLQDHVLETRIASVLRSGQQEMILLVLLALFEILLRVPDKSSAQEIKRKTVGWIEAMHRSLPEEMQLGFETRQDFKRLIGSKWKKSRGLVLSRERFLSFARINKRLSQESNIPSILQQVMDAAMALVGAERGFLLVKSASADHALIPGFRVETARNLKQENINSEEFKIGLSAVEEAIRRRVAIVTDDAQSDPHFKESESIHLYQLKSILVLPLIGETECLGALYLDHRFEMGGFSEEELLFLKAFADQAVLAIEKAKNLTELHRAKLALETRVERQTAKIEKMEVELREARSGLKYGYESIIGHSPKMIRILKLLDRITDTMVSVWIHGDSGTGKELIAQALHFNSDRKDQPFITENCSAIPENLLESVLFGHVKGAFTHADRDKMGLFEAANGGTIFLDEIGDMPLPMQSKLLRVLQEGEIRRVGSNETVPVDVRVVSATNKDLPRMVKEGKFREDLFFRLNGIKIELPPLRERKEDIPLLVQHFIQKVAEENGFVPNTISEEALSLMARYDWPGNIRELENTVRNAVLFSEGKMIGVETLGFKPEFFEPMKLMERRGVGGAAIRHGVSRSGDAQREALLDALFNTGFHKGQAAQELKITPRHLYNLLEKYRLPKNKWALKKLVEEERRA